jgi:hypothetical protein
MAPMNFRSKRMIVVAATTLAVVGGGAAAVAATSSNSRGSDFLDSVAKHLGVTPQKLEDATKAAAIDQVNADLAAGRITQAQADELKKRIEAGDGVFGPGGPRIGPGPGLGGPGGGGLPGFGRPAIANEIAAAAKYLGLSEADLQTKLRDGQSLADIAKAQSKDLDGLKTAILDAAKADLDKAVADKKLTQSQADDVYNALKSHIDDLVAASGKLRFHGPGGGPGGPGFGFGADTAAAAKYLGLDQSALRAKLRSGQSLADVAKAQNKDVQGLEDAIVASQKARLDKAVSDKKLTQSQADDIVAKLKAHVADLVNAKPGDRPAFRGRRGAGPRFFFGP